MLKRIILFLLLNFGALAIGGIFTGNGVPSEWYQDLNKAPWTPPGWVFGAAWTFIMITFAIYMAYLVKMEKDRNKLIVLFSLQWILNIIWNPLFFYFQLPLIGMISISCLTLLIAYIFFSYSKRMRAKSWLLAPYLIWLLIATSLNGYILLYN